MRMIAAAALLAIVVAAPARAHAVSARPLSPVDASELADGAGLSAPGRMPTLPLAAPPSFSTWGGRYLTPGGAWVTVLVSNAYPQDDARAQQWADFLDSLVHGDEIARVTLVLAPPAEIQSACGLPSALACYLAQRATIYAPGTDPSPTTSAESIVAHEYGHHIEASRSNAPWHALDYGTKRWATYAHICAGVAGGLYFPGAETAGRYALNPGEGFAEAYRVLNERRLGLPSGPWQLVTSAFYPDDGALAAIEQDITSPWSADATSSVSGRFARMDHDRRWAGVPSDDTPSTTWQTPLDGAASVTIRVSRHLRARVDVYSDEGLVASATPAGRQAVVTAPICGHRELTTVVTRLAGRGRYTLTLSYPEEPATGTSEARNPG